MQVEHALSSLQSFVASAPDKPAAASSSAHRPRRPTQGSHGPHSPTVQLHQYAQYDTDGDGVISREEFAAVSSPRLRGMSTLFDNA